MNKEFSPKRNIADRYSIESMAKSQGLSVEEFKIRIKEELKIKNDLIQKYLDKGYTQELRILYIPSFGGGTFKD
jgi:hypothetical protein